MNTTTRNPRSDSTSAFVETVRRYIMRTEWNSRVMQFGRDQPFWPSFDEKSIADFISNGGCKYLPGKCIITPFGFPYKDSRSLPPQSTTHVVRRIQRKRAVRSYASHQLTGVDALEEAIGLLPADDPSAPLVPRNRKLFLPEEITTELLLQAGGGYLPTLPVTMSAESEFVIKLVENVLTFVRLLSKAKDVEDYALAVAVFAQCRSDTSMTSFLLERWNDLMGLELQDGDAIPKISALRDILDRYQNIKELPIFTKVYRFLLYCIGTSLFEKMGIKINTQRFFSMEEAAIKRQFHLGPDFVHCILDTICYVAETGQQCMVTGSLDPFLHHESTYGAWIKEGELLREQANYLSNPTPHNFTVFDFLCRLNDNIDRGQAIMKFMGKGDGAAPIIRRILSELCAIRASCLTKRLAQQEREAPFSVLVHGGSSVGKSSFTKLLFYHFGKLFDLPTGDEYRYSRNAFDQYWTNFCTYQWCIQLDDIAYLHPDKTSECDPSLVEMLQVINNVPFVPTQADIADKGKTPVQAKFVIATTNTEHLNAEAYFACPLAVSRRLPFVITIEPKDEYRRDGGPMLDPSKLPQIQEGSYPDYWKITVKRVVPQTGVVKRHMGQTATTVPVGVYTDVLKFLKWFSEVSKNHRATQEQAINCDKYMEAVKLCPHGIPDVSCGECSVSLQSGSIVSTIKSLRHFGYWKGLELCGHYIPRPCCFVCGGIPPDIPPVPLGVPTRATPHPSEDDSIRDWARFPTPDRSPLEIEWPAADDPILRRPDPLDIRWKHRTYGWCTLHDCEHWSPFECKGDSIPDHPAPRWKQVMYCFLCEAPHPNAARCLKGTTGTGFVNRHTDPPIREPPPGSWFASHENHSRDEFFSDPPPPDPVRRAVEKMSVLNRLLICYYLLLLWIAERFPFWGNFFVSYMFGNWWMVWIMCRFLHVPEIRILTIRLIGARAYRAAHTTKGVYLCASIVMAVTLIKTYRAAWNFLAAPTPTPTEVQGVEQERGVKPESRDDKRENVWYKDTYECTPIDLPSTSSSRANWTMDELTKHVSTNCASFVARAAIGTDMIREKTGKAVCIGGNMYMVNNHCVPDSTFQMSLTFQSSKDGVTTNVECNITPGLVTRYPERDLAFINVTNALPKKDIRNLFAKVTYEGRHDCEYIMRGRDGDVERRRVRAPRIDRDFCFTDGVDIRTPAWKGKVDTPTIAGDCGSLLACVTPLGPVLIGIHVLGGTDGSCVTLGVDHEFLMGLPFDIFNRGAPTLQVGAYTQTLVDLNKKATVRYIQNGTAGVFGSFAGFRGKLRSRVRPTFLSDVAVRDGYPINTGVPIMNTWVPWRRALLDLTKPKGSIDQDRLELCWRGYLSDVLTGLDPALLTEVRVYDLNTAINGCPGLAFVDKMPRNTSAGFPFRKTKKFFLEAIAPFDDYSHPVKLTAEVEREVGNIIRGYEEGNLYCPIFSASLKDEPTSFKKISLGKVRVICGAPLHWSIVGRMYYLSLIRLIQTNRFLFEAGPGTVAQSFEWHKLREYLVAFGVDRMIAGDYATFDRSMEACVVLAAFKILIGIMRAAGWSDRDMRVAMGIAIDTAYPHTDFHGDFMQFVGSNPSGHILTVIINCLVNSIYCRYAYIDGNPSKECGSFKSNVHLFTYGDDLVMGVSPLCTWFSHTTMVKTMGDIGVGFTMADKEAESIPFIHIDDVSFLRRTWRFDVDLRCFVCPIEHASIEKMLTMCVESKTISLELHAIAVLETALREYFWYGKAIFEEKTLLFEAWVAELGLSAYKERAFCTWEQLAQEFKSNSNLGCLAPELKPDTETSAESHSNPHTATEVAPPSGFASPPVVFTAFEQTNDAHKGVCQSCALGLDPVQCVVHLEPRTSSIVEVSDSLRELPLRLQSGEEIIGDASEASQVTGGAVIDFLDEDPGSSWSISSSAGSRLNDLQPHVDLAQFLSRPVLIKIHSWSQADNYITASSWNPWHLFFSSAPIQRKINNYAFISCKLKLKFVVNAAPFYSGAMAFTYCPLQSLTGETIVADTSGAELMLYSQRPKVWVFPQTNQGGELTLPFLYHKNWLDLTVAADVQAMGTITPCLFAPLVSANGAVGQSVVINVYAWAEDVKLHAPTTKLTLQGSEFDYKPSQIASAISAASGSLSSVPAIGPYMKATSMVTGAAGKLAAAFGFTNVPNIATVGGSKTLAYPHNSTCEVSVPADRSSVDPRNEVTIDPRTVGLDGTDELSIAYICGRETWLGNAILSSTDNVDALTLVSRVTPALVFSAGANKPYQMTPMGYMCTQFERWRGDIIFRFKFVCTRFHKGRVRITFDPVNDISTIVPDYTTVFNEVLDIGAEQDVEVRVPYMQAITFLRTSFTTGNYNLSGAAVSPNTVIGNGLITMRVVNPLSGPLATSAIPVMVFVRAAENIEFAAPLNMFGGGLSTASPLALQSGEVTYPVTPTAVSIGVATSADPHRHSVHFGESVVSLRPLLHRLAHQYTVKADLPGSQASTLCAFSQSRRIAYPGFVSNGPWTATKVIGVGSSAYNYNRFGIHQFVSLMFVGERGSINHSINLESSNTQPDNLQMARNPKTITAANYSVVTSTPSANPSFVAKFYADNQLDYGSGTALTSAKYQPGIVMNFPYYSPFNFQLVAADKAVAGQPEDHTNTDNVTTRAFFSVVGAGTTCRVNVWSGYGPDYNFFFFKNVPSLYVYANPTPV